MHALRSAVEVYTRITEGVNPRVNCQYWDDAASTAKSGFEIRFPKRGSRPSHTTEYADERARKQRAPQLSSSILQHS